MLLRLVIVAVVLAAAWLVVGTMGRRRGPATAGSRLPAGVTVVTGPDCRLCGPALDALAAAAPDLAPHVVAGPPELLEALRVRALPTVLVVDRSGVVVLRRSGREAVAGAGDVAAAGRRVSA